MARRKATSSAYVSSDRDTTARRSRSLPDRSRSVAYEPKSTTRHTRSGAARAGGGASGSRGGLFVGRNLHVGVTWRDPVAGLEDVGRRWDKAKLDWAATGVVAASVLAPYLASVTVRRLAQKIDGLPVAPWPRVYVDLLSFGVRGEDAAEHLREVVHAR